MAVRFKWCLRQVSSLLSYYKILSSTLPLHTHTNLYFWLTIQNTAISQVSNPFGVTAVFISFPLARCCAPTHPATPFGRGKYQKKIAGVIEIKKVVSWCR